MVLGQLDIHMVKKGGEHLSAGLTPFTEMN